MRSWQLCPWPHCEKEIHFINVFLAITMAGPGPKMSFSEKDLFVIMIDHKIKDSQKLMEFISLERSFTQEETDNLKNYSKHE